MAWLLAAYSDRYTYGSLAHSLLGLPIGVFGFVVIVSGFSIGLGLIVTLLGIPILVATLLFARALAALHRRLAWSLLGATMPRRAQSQPAAAGIFWQRLRELVSGRRTWREVGYILLALPLGILGFTVVLTVVGLMLGGLAQPIVVAVVGETQIGSWVIDTFLESLVYLPFSLVFLLVGPRIVLGWGGISGRITTHFLGQVDFDEIKSAVLETLARTGETDAFTVFGQLELRIGRGPFLSPTRVEAALLALESTGQVEVDRSTSTTRYSLSGGRQLEQT